MRGNFGGGREALLSDSLDGRGRVVISKPKREKRRGVLGEGKESISGVEANSIARSCPGNDNVPEIEEGRLPGETPSSLEEKG